VVELMGAQDDALVALIAGLVLCGGLFCLTAVWIPAWLDARAVKRAPRNR